jgi:hypothetical protein
MFHDEIDVFLLVFGRFPTNETVLLKMRMVPILFGNVISSRRLEG